VPGIEDNVATWNAASSWTADGDEWSGRWGSSEAQWWGSLLPRVHTFLPAKTILELGPGHGRWSAYLKDTCDELILVDLAEECIEACKTRFAQAGNIAYHVNDGRTLPQVAEHTVDLAFSFDSLVHAEADALESYASELARTLTPDGVAFIHHSNMGALRAQAGLARRIPERLRRPLTARGAVVNLYAWRASSPSATWFAEVCGQAGLVCIAQERIAWEYGRHLTDAITTVTPRGSRWERAMVAVDNPRFMDEARIERQVGQLYARQSFPSRGS
jgi:SAM-dependent methyltransferase